MPSIVDENIRDQIQADGLLHFLAQLSVEQATVYIIGLAAAWAFSQAYAAIYWEYVTRAWFNLLHPTDEQAKIRKLRALDRLRAQEITALKELLVNVMIEDEKLAAENGQLRAEIERLRAESG
jgi:hypothetical protein